MANAKLNAGIFNQYTVMPHNLTQYAAFRGVTDFTQIGQFDQFETGYNFLRVIKMPDFIEEAAKYDTNIAKMAFSFKHMLEYEFRGLTGLPDITAQTGTITDGINEAYYINQVKMDTSVTVDMNFFEKTGSLIEKFSEYYLTGIKDRVSEVKTYHGLIRRGILEPGLEHEVFTLLYYVTDNTMLRLERAWLLCNAQITDAKSSMYASNKGDINNYEYQLSFNCFPVMGEEVDKAASTLLEDITGVEINGSGDTAADIYHERVQEGTYIADETFGDTGLSKPLSTAQLDSNSYRWGIMGHKNDGRPATATEIYNGIDVLRDAVDGNGVIGNDAAIV